MKLNEKEFYKARAEGFDIVSELHEKYSNESLLEFLNAAFRLFKENSDDFEKHRIEKILGKAEGRKKLINLDKR
jgi:hypothetical protein